MLLLITRSSNVFGPILNPDVTTCKGLIAAQPLLPDIAPCPYSNGPPFKYTSTRLSPATENSSRAVAKSVTLKLVVKLYVPPGHAAV